MIEVCVDTIWQGKVAIRQQYIEEARLYNESLIICHGKDKMLIKYPDLQASIVSLSPHKMRDKFGKNPPGYLYYFDWQPQIIQKEMVL